MANKNVFLGQGKVFEEVDGVLRYLGDAESLTLEVNQKFVDIHESTSGKRMVSNHIAVETVPSLKLVLKEWSIENLSRVLYGATEGAKIAGTVTAEAVTANAKSFAFLKHLNVSSLVLKSGATTLVEGTDYKVDLKGGVVEFLAGSTIVTGSTPIALTADYSYAAYAGKVEGFMNGTKSSKIIYSGVNIADDFARVRVEIKSVIFGLPKKMSFIDNKENPLELDGMMLQDTSVAVGESEFFTMIKA